MSDTLSSFAGRRWPRRAAPLLILLASLLQSPAGLAVAPPQGASQAELAAGKSRFDKLCTTCHGKAGDGQPGHAPRLQQRADLEADFIRERITSGKHGEHAMPAWGTVLKPADIDELVAYVSWLSRRSGAVAQAAVPPFSLDDPTRIEAGRKRFNKTCAGYCHGFEGIGGRAPDFKGRKDLPVQTVFETITHGRVGDDVMPPWGDAFSEAQIWELVAYIRYLGTQSVE